MAQQPNFNKLVLLQGFSNYFDRKIFYYSRLSEYIYAASAYYTQSDINFNPNDGVETTVDLSSLDASLDESVIVHEFSYLLVLDANDDIVSRWFIMEIVRTTNGIYRFTLRRDVVAESISNTTFVATAPIYIEKGKLLDTDPMIVNSEGMIFNQIKRSETLLKDPAGWGYIVGYFEKGATANVTFDSGVDFTPDNYVTQPQIANETGLSNDDVLNLIQGNPVSIAVSDFSLVYGVKFSGLYNMPDQIRKQQIILPNRGYVGNTLNNSYCNLNVLALSWANNIGKKATSVADKLDVIANSINSNTVASIRTALQDAIRNDVPTESLYLKESYNSIYDLEGKILYSSGAYYKIHVRATGGAEKHSEVVISKNEVSLFDTAIAAAFTAAGDQESNDWRLYLNFDIVSLTFELTPYAGTSYSVDIPNNANTLKDAPYSMFVIPYCDNMALIANGNVTYDDDMMNQEQALAAAAAIATKMGSKLYDIQLLPYIPSFEDWMNYWGSSSTPYLWRVNLKNKTYNQDYVDIKTAGNDVVGVVIFPNYSNFSFTLNYMLTHEDEMKIESQCNFYRLCSPNYSGLFEFNLAKNGGVSSFFEVYCTYKPINPFIRISPQFDFLYGMNFKDGRGLICGGDFSLPIVTSAWVEYENRNKNYGIIFSRDIQNLDFAQRQERFKEPFELGAGIVGATAGGAVAGAKAGGAYGAAAGAAIGLAAGSIGAYLDSNLAEQRRAETKDYMIDRFNMSLGNIKAIPNSLTRNSAFTIVNKIFPFVEYYSCTEEEKDALRKKIQYDGMTVGRIGYLSDFMGGNLNQNYFKGQLIRAEGILDDDHFIKVLYGELAKGVYI